MFCCTSAPSMRSGSFAFGFSFRNGRKLELSLHTGVEKRVCGFSISCEVRKEVKENEPSSSWVIMDSVVYTDAMNENSHIVRLHDIVYAKRFVRLHGLVDTMEDSRKKGVNQRKIAIRRQILDPVQILEVGGKVLSVNFSPYSNKVDDCLNGGQGAGRHIARQSRKLRKRAEVDVIAGLRNLVQRLSLFHAPQSYRHHSLHELLERLDEVRRVCRHCDIFGAIRNN